jgi:hypothetical protein
MTAVTDPPSLSGAVPGELRVYGIFTVTPIVNHYAVRQSPLHYDGRTRSANSTIR